MFADSTNSLDRPYSRVAISCNCSSVVISATHSTCEAPHSWRFGFLSCTCLVHRGIRLQECRKGLVITLGNGTFPLTGCLVKAPFWTLQAVFNALKNSILVFFRTSLE